MTAEQLYSQTHYVGDVLPAGNKSRAFWARDPRGVLVVFVHGWWGDPTTTWSQFHELVCGNFSPKFKGADVLFFGYPSVRRSATVGGGLLFNFLDEFLSRDGKHQADFILDESALKKRPISYQKIVLVCHSMGAIVSRLALLQAFEKHRIWASRCRLVLFAPAHCGAILAELVGSVVSSLADEVYPVLSYFVPGLKELHPESKFISELAKDTRAALRRNPESRRALICRHTWIGDDDKVVKRDWRFVDDPKANSTPGKNHKSICKPCLHYPDPFHQVEAAL